MAMTNTSAIAAAPTDTAVAPDVTFVVPVALTVIGPPALVLPVEVTSAVVVRLESAKSRVMPTERPAPTVAMIDSAELVLVPSAVTETPPLTWPYAPEDALVEPEIVETATAPPRAPAMPASTEIARVGTVMLECALTLTAPALWPRLPSATWPMAAFVSPSPWVTAMAAPAATPASATPIARASTSRSAEAETLRVPSTRGTEALDAIVAACSFLLLITTTWAPTVTSPVWPAKPMPLLFSVDAAATTTAPPAVTCEFRPADVPSGRSPELSSWLTTFDPGAPPETEPLFWAM